jgi:hypothetical protein
MIHFAAFVNVRRPLARVPPKSKLAAQIIELDEIKRTFEEAERRFPVDCWVVDTLHIWPIVRNDLYLKMFAGYFPAGADPVDAPPKIFARAFAVLGRFAQVVGDFVRPSRALLAQRFRVDGCQALLLSDGLSFTSVAGRTFEKFCDPVGQALAAKGKSANLMNPSKDEQRSATTKTVFIRDLLDTARMRSRLKGATGLEAMRAELDGYPEFSDWVLRKHALRVISEGDLRTVAQTIQAYASVFERIILRTGARIGFLCAYYCNEGYAFSLACRRRNILAVDIQHGVGDDVHMAYVGWERAPVAGYELIPSAFWCWSENDVAVLSRWTRRHAGYHRPYLGANLLLEAYRSGLGDVSPEERAQLLELIAACDSARRGGTTTIALVSLQPNYITDPEWRHRLHQMMAAVGDDVVWWMRLHPSMVGSLDLAESMGPIGLRTEYRLSSSLPLYLLLQRADVHLTHCSSTVIEAAAFGMHSLLLSQLGADYFSRAILDGKATQVREVQEFSPIFQQAVSSRVPAKIARSEAAERLERAHRTLLELVETDRN